MKHFMYMLTMIFLLCSTTATSSQKTKKPDTYKIFKTIINGSWCQADYLLDINNTKSPVRSKNKLWQIVLMNINTKSIKNNKLTVEAPSVHEGGTFNIDFKKKAIAANAASTDITDYDHLKEGGYFYELGFVLSLIEPGKVDTSLVLYHYNNKKILIDETKYLRSFTGEYDALQYMVANTLITGNYKGVDDAGKPLQLTFTNSGIVKGLASIKKYYVLTDFVAQFGKGMDEICFDIQTTNQICYCFEIDGNCLKLYAVKNDKKGELKYNLTKQPVK